MTPFSSVAILEKLALLKIAFCKAPVLSRASSRRTSVMTSTVPAASSAKATITGPFAIFSVPFRVLFLLCSYPDNPCTSDAKHRSSGMREEIPVVAPKGSACTDRKSTRLNSSHLGISYAVFCLKKKKKKKNTQTMYDKSARARYAVTSHVRSPHRAASHSVSVCLLSVFSLVLFFFFFFNDTATTEIYTLSLHDALPICDEGAAGNASSHRFLLFA